jgi:hypothetical protein
MFQPNCPSSGAELLLQGYCHGFLFRLVLRCNHASLVLLTNKTIKLNMCMAVEQYQPKKEPVAIAVGHLQVYSWSYKDHFVRTVHLMMANYTETCRVRLLKSYPLRKKVRNSENLVIK